MQSIRHAKRLASIWLFMLMETLTICVAAQADGFVETTHMTGKTVEGREIICLGHISIFLGRRLENKLSEFNPNFQIGMTRYLYKVGQAWLLGAGRKSIQLTLAPCIQADRPVDSGQPLGKNNYRILKFSWHQCIYCLQFCQPGAKNKPRWNCEPWGHSSNAAGQISSSGEPQVSNLTPNCRLRWSSSLLFLLLSAIFVMKMGHVD